MTDPTAPSVLICEWAADEDGNWHTDCDECHVLIDGTPTMNGMKFCCYCGKPLRDRIFVEASDD